MVRARLVYGCPEWAELWDDGMKAWKFGREQTAEQEREEIHKAKAAGLSWQYVQGQRYAELIEQELALRRARVRR